MPAGGHLKAFHGILNSTTNLILTRMEGGESFEQAVGYAQSIGIAETDPSGDIDGWDAAVKVAALVTVLMGIPLKPAQVDRSGIRSITRMLFSGLPGKANAGSWFVWRNAQARRLPRSVKPELVGSDSPCMG